MQTPLQSKSDPRLEVEDCSVSARAQRAKSGRFRNVRPLIRNVLRSWSLDGAVGKTSAPWQDGILRDRDQSEDTLRKTHVVLDLFPGLFEEATAVAQYFLRSPHVTRAKVEAAVVAYVLEEYTCFDHLDPSISDLAVIPEFREMLATSCIDSHHYVVAMIGYQWRLALRRWLPLDMDPPSLDAFWQYHRLEAVELDRDFEYMLDRYHTLYPHGGTANAFIRQHAGRLPPQKPPTTFWV